MDPNILCTPETCDWYINAPKYYNCFLVYRYFIKDYEHTLQEVASRMDISHTTVKQIESQALKKLKEQIVKGSLKLEDLKQIIKS